MVGRADVNSVILDELRALRSDTSTIKEQVIKTNGRVNRAEQEIESIKASARVIDRRVDALLHDKLLREELSKEKIRSTKRFQWLLDHLQRWAPTIVSIVVLVLAIKV